MVVFNVVTIKEKEPQKTFQSLPYNAFVGAEAELFDINAMFANFWPTIIEDQCSSILLCQCTSFNVFLSKDSQKHQRLAFVLVPQTSSTTSENRIARQWTIIFRIARLTVLDKAGLAKELDMMQ